MKGIGGLRRDGLPEQLLKFVTYFNYDGVKSLMDRK